MKNLVSVCITTLVTLTAFAGKPSIDDLVNQFYAQKENTVIKKSKPLVSHPPDCHPPTSPTCLDAACLKLGSFGCDDISEVQEIGRACRGNYNGICLNEACDKLGSFGCDDKIEVQTVARACVGNTDTTCFQSVCKRLGSFGCDNLKEVEDVLRSCSGY